MRENTTGELLVSLVDKEIDRLLATKPDSGCPRCAEMHGNYIAGQLTALRKARRDLIELAVAS